MKPFTSYQGAVNQETLDILRPILEMTIRTGDSLSADRHLEALRAAMQLAELRRQAAQIEHLASELERSPPPSVVSYRTPDHPDPAAQTRDVGVIPSTKSSGHGEARVSAAKSRRRPSSI
jgi:hypothetical protein